MAKVRKRLDLSHAVVHSIHVSTKTSTFISQEAGDGGLPLREHGDHPGCDDDAEHSKCSYGIGGRQSYDYRCSGLNCSVEAYRSANPLYDEFDDRQT